MWNRPHHIYRIPAQGTAEDTYRYLHHIETEVPGALLYAFTYHGRVRPAKMPDFDQSLDSVEAFQIQVPSNGAWLIEQKLASVSLGYAVDARNQPEQVLFWSNDPEWRRRIGAIGALYIRDAERRGVLRVVPHEPFHPYQEAVAGFAVYAPALFEDIKCGGGKTRCALAAMAIRLRDAPRHQPIVVVVPAEAFAVWHDQVPKYTTWVPYFIKARSKRLKRDGTALDYLAACAEAGRRPFFVVGRTNLPHVVAEVKSLDPVLIAIDEIHGLGLGDFWTAVTDQSGNRQARVRTTKGAQAEADAEYRAALDAARERAKVAGTEFDPSAVARPTGKKPTKSVAMMQVATHKSVQYGIGLTASAIDEGYVLRLFGQFYYVWPGGIGHSSYPFEIRYCARRRTEGGFPFRKGKSNFDELMARTSMFVAKVPPDEVDKYMPPLTVRVQRLGKDAQNQAGTAVNKQYRAEIKRLSRDALKDPRARGHLAEAQLAWAAWKKKRTAIQLAVDCVLGGGRAVLYTTRKALVGELAKGVRKALSAAGRKSVWVWEVTGDTPKAEADRTLTRHAALREPAVGVGTVHKIGQSKDAFKHTQLGVAVTLSYRPIWWIQPPGRHRRLGGAAAEFVFLHAEGTFDDEVVENVLPKLDTAQAWSSGGIVEEIDEQLIGGEEEDLASAFLAGITV